MNPQHRPAAWAALYVLVAAALIAMVLVVVRTYSVTSEIRDSQVTGIQARKSSDATLDAVRSCTTPGRQCYEAGKQQTAGAVANINRVVILAAACSVGLDPHMKVADRQTAIQNCVIDRLARQR